VVSPAQAAWLNRKRRQKRNSADVDIVGGVELGATGAVGTIYEGYVRGPGDDFAELDILAPHLPRGKYYPTRVYLPGSRGSDTALGDQFDTDPFVTGHNDSNRGVPVGFDTMSVENSILSLVARAASAPELPHMNGRAIAAAMIASPGAFYWHADAAGTGDIILEARVRFTDDAPGGWHPTLWTQSLNPTIAIDSDEIDHEGNSVEAYFNKNLWEGGERSGATSLTTFEHDGEFHVVSIIINKTNIRRYIDGVLLDTLNESGNELDKPQYALLTNHVVNTTFEGDAYDEPGWLANTAGSALDMDWWRIWRRAGTSNFVPLVEVADRYVDYGGSLVFALPSALTIWGDADVTEYLQVVYNEENEPGVAHLSVFDQFPPGVSYNAGTREITVSISSGKTGRLNFVLAAWKDGCTGVPLRFAVNVGPIAVLPPSLGEDEEDVSIDLYVLQDFGVLTSDGGGKAATIEVTGLEAAGLSYDDETGIITGTAVAGTYELTVTITNSVGQTDTITGNAAVGAFNPAEWAEVVEWWDASDNSTVFSDFAATTPAVADTDAVQAVVGKILGVKIGNNVGAQTPEYVTDANGRKALQFVRANNDYLRTSDGTIIGEVSGNDNAFTYLAAVKRGTPDTAGAIASWSPDAGSALNYIRINYGSSDNISFVRTISGTQTVANSANDLAPADDWDVISVCFRGTTVFVRLNGVLVINGAAMDVGNLVVNRMSWGGYYDDVANAYATALAFDGRVGEKMLLTGNVNHDDATLHLAEEYLMAKWTN
jgi:hypothetical protein